MALSVVDRIPTYPGRVTLTLVAGNVYTLARADEPSVVGTPINKALFDAVDAEIVAITDLQFSDLSVLTTDWGADATYASFPFRAAVICAGALATMIPDITFEPEIASTGILAPVGDTYAGGVYVYARAVPSSTVTISSIVLKKAVA